MSIFRSAARSLTWPAALLFITAAAVCFHAAYLPTGFGPTRLLMIGYPICLVQLARLPTTRQSFYGGLVTGILCVAPQLIFFWKIFGPAAIVLWIILAFWIGAFTGITHATLARLGSVWATALIPFVWMGLEYFRSELYYLKFSWLNVGYAFSNWQIFPFHILGMYGVGFVVALCAAFFLAFRWLYATLLTLVLIIGGAFLSPGRAATHKAPEVHIAGLQMEFPLEQQIPTALDSLIAKYPKADLVVLSEYTLDGPVPEKLKAWCRDHRRYLVVGGKDPAPNNNFYNTAFVVSPDGEVVFKQVKSVPIQFFKDGLPAIEQNVWNSPWGKIGFCVCYDLSYTRVTDRLVRKGAQLLIVPTMDVADWGYREHELHTLVAPVRAAEYRVPIFRLASSGISQAVAADGRVLASAPFEGEGKDMFATIQLSNQASLPIDRYLAPVAVCITALLLAAFCLCRPKAESTTQPSPNIREEKTHSEPAQPPA